MVAMATMEQCLTEEKLTPVAVGSDVAVVHNVVEIHEEKVFVQLEKLEVSCNTKVWILDTAATNHMNGSCVVFVNLDNHVRRTVRFGDDSTVRIKGLGVSNSSARTTSGEHCQVCILFPNSWPIYCVWVAWMMMVTRCLSVGENWPSGSLEGDCWPR
jgi:hypothetical protein